jgi:hypothetical protein
MAVASTETIPTAVANADLALDRHGELVDEVA